MPCFPGASSEKGIRGEPANSATLWPVGHGRELLRPRQGRPPPLPAGPAGLVWGLAFTGPGRLEPVPLSILARAPRSPAEPPCPPRDGQQCPDGRATELSSRGDRVCAGPPVSAHEARGQGRGPAARDRPGGSPQGDGRERRLSGQTPRSRAQGGKGRGPRSQPLDGST